jgi:hypothetical protein
MFAQSKIEWPVKCQSHTKASRSSWKDTVCHVNSQGDADDQVIVWKVLTTLSDNLPKDVFFFATTEAANRVTGNFVFSLDHFFDTLLSQCRVKSTLNNGEEILCGLSTA